MIKPHLLRLLRSSFLLSSWDSLVEADITSNTLDNYVYLSTKNQPTEDSKPSATRPLELLLGI